MIAGPAHLIRLGHAGFVFAHEGVFAGIDTTLLPPPARAAVRLARLIERPASAVAANRIVAALTRLGPAYVKLGQFLATRPDVVGVALARELETLQDKMAPFSQVDAERAVAAALGKPLSDLFASFGAPVAAASIAQVHRAAVSTDRGLRAVAVKVLRPGVERRFKVDLDAFTFAARSAEKISAEARRLRLVEVVETLRRTVAIEMDLRFEAAAASELSENFAGDPAFRVPQVDWRRTGRTVLTTERIGGIRVDDREALIAAGHSIDDLLRNAADAFFKQVFRDGFFHADLHPGNMFVEADGTLAVVDFGIMGRLDRATRYYLADMLIGFLTGDYRRVAEVHFDAGYVPRQRSLDAFTQACRSIGEPILGRPLHEISIARLLAQLFQVTEQFEMETQPQLLLLQKTMVLVEGVGRRLDPDVNIWSLARPLIEEWMRDNRGPEARLRQQIDTVLETLDEIPRLLRSLDRLVGDWSREGVILHAESLATQAAHRARLFPLLVLPLWFAAAALVAIAVAVVAGR